MVSDLKLTHCYSQSFTFDDHEAVLKDVLIRSFNELFEEKIKDIHAYGMPHLGSPLVVERFSKQDGLAVIRRPQSSDLIMRIIYANWRSLASKRGLAFLEFILQMLWANQWEIVRLYHSISRQDDYPNHLVEANLPENFLTSRIFVLSGDELIVQAEHEDEQDDEGQAIGQVAAHPVVHLEAVAGVDFLLVVVPAPAVAGDAEQQVDEGAERQEEVADEEVLQIQHCAAEDGETVPCPDIVAQHAGQ